MSFICSSCKFEFEKDFNFCPECGTEKSLPIAESDVRTEIKEFLICAACGDENPVGSNYCHSCGIKLDSTAEVVSKETTVKNEKPFEKNVSIKPKPPVKKQVQKKKNIVVNLPKSEIIKTKDSLDEKKLFLIIAAVVLIGVIILYGAGVFETHKVVESSSAQANQPQTNSGVDLKNLQQINNLRDVVQNIPENYSAVLELAHLLMDSRLFAEAIENYKKYLIKNPNEPDVLVDMGVCFFELEKHDEAIVNMEKAIKINPSHQIGHLNLGIVNLSKGNVEIANQWFKKAIDLNPGTEIAQRARHLLESH
ncbi:MAG: zinc ribbon domain-containing protein [Ignavibacteria bacterium]|nr:zinc ribbon domain-containing protein [Ignavibacteria bacterium]